jgi:hypothetical protein
MTGNEHIHVLEWISTVLYVEFIIIRENITKDSYPVV